MPPKRDDQYAKRLEIYGIVQGVGFRPFVYQLANRYGIKGEVANTSTGVSIHVEGINENIDSFMEALRVEFPPLARITEIKSCEDTIRGLSDFSISKSRKQDATSTLIAPDSAVCSDCLEELFNPNDRRYLYPFINCTNCGPRYTIITDIPYDRPNTSMSAFRMCERCRTEYDDPMDRRFHAQPNACAECGPTVTLYDTKQNQINTSDAIRKTAELLKLGRIVAVKGLGGFHLAVDAENSEAVESLRKRKHREEKPFALMAYSETEILRFAHIQPEERLILNTPQRPIVLLKKRNPHTISDAVSPRNRYFGTMLPYTPLHYILLGFDFTALVMTSGNISEEPIAIGNQEAFERLADIADYFLIHDRDIYVRSDDSILIHAGDAPRMLRRARGYVPVPVRLENSYPPILACGAELKNTFCLTKGREVFLSQHMGDLENQQAYTFYQTTIEHMKRILDIEPEVIAYDLHPDYLSTQYALALPDKEKIGIQHHHAHIVSCMAENRLEGPVIGLSFDGTGYGEDGNIWGGEVMAAEPGRYSRAAHFSYVSMPGGSAAIKEPWRMGVSYLLDGFGDAYKDFNLPLLDTVEADRILFIEKMIANRVNTPLTSSLGRLFDGVAAIVGIRNRVLFEGQAAMELEMIADETVIETYPYEWINEDPYKIQAAPIIRGVVDDMQNRIPLPVIGGKFHATLIRMFSELCEEIRKENGLDRVVLSGGVFQNSILLFGLIRALEGMHFNVYTHKLVPTNDGGICIGQAVAAHAQIKAR